MTRRQRYVRDAIELYQRLAGGQVRPRRQDRQLAAQLHDQGVTLATLEAAIRLAMARRNDRPEHLPRLQPVRSLHYFRAVVDEIKDDNQIDFYLQYLRARSHD